MSGGVPAGSRDQVAQIVARAYGGSLYPGIGTPGDYPTAEVDYRAADAILALPTPTPPIEGRDADVERAIVTLDAFLAAYRHRPDHKLARPIADDDLLTWGDLRVILAALQALGERG